jgi:hypothetical protein
MSRRIRAAVSAAFATVILAGALCFNTVTASAQIPFGWNPPCTQTVVRNATNCTVTLVLRHTPVGSIAPITVPPNTSLPLVIPAGTLIGGAFTQAGNFVPAVLPGPPLPGTVAPLTFAYCQGVTTGPMGCCVDLYFVNSAAPSCVIYIFPGTPPCTP